MKKERTHDTAYLPPLLSAIEALHAGASVAVSLLDLTLNKALDSAPQTKRS